MIASFVLLLPHLLRVKDSDLVTVQLSQFFSVSSKILAKDIWQGAVETECLIVWGFVCFLFWFLKRGRNAILMEEKEISAFLEVTQEQRWI